MGRLCGLLDRDTSLAIASMFVLAPLDDIAFYVLITLLFGWFGVMGFRLRELAERAE